MIEITFLGRIVATLASTLAFVFLLGVLFAAAYVLATAAAAIEALPAPPGLVPDAERRAGRRRLSSWITGLFFVAAFAASIAALSVGGTATSLLFALGLAGVCWSGAGVCLGTFARLSDVQKARRARASRSLLASERAARMKLEADAARKLAGADLLAEVADADASLERLREALSALRDTRAALGHKLTASQGKNTPPLLDPAIVALRDELGLRIDLGERVLRAAEAAAFRLACGVPVKKLVRRRPVEPLALDPRGSGDLGARVDQAMRGVDAYLGTIAETRVELDELAQRRPTLPPPGEDELADTRGAAVPRDPLERASREIDVIERAYRALRDRLELFRLGLRARAGLSEVASAAGRVSAQAEANGLPEGELAQLVDDLSRAERATAVELPLDDEDLRALAEVLARGTSAFEKDDRVSLGEIVAALGELG